MIDVATSLLFDTYTAYDEGIIHHFVRLLAADDGQGIDQAWDELAERYDTLQLSALYIEACQRFHH